MRGSWANERTDTVLEEHEKAAVGGKTLRWYSAALMSVIGDERE
jgi:hypothetical protein